MITFHDITLADKSTIEQYTLGSVRQNCDLSFVNLFGWHFLYQTQWAVMDGFLLFRFYTGTHLAYMMPIGSGDVKPVLAAMIADARSLGHPFRLLGICSYVKNLLDEMMPHKFQFSTDRNYADYVYLRNDLVTLRGKKYQAKRNHIHRFQNFFPSYEYRPLTSDMVAACMELEMVWCRENDAAENVALQAERQFMTTALAHYDALGLQGGALYVNGKMVAFTFGAPINANTFDICIEKATTEIDGTYAVINQAFAAHIPEQYTFINREEDLGIEGLRKAKLSYHPERLIEKYMALMIE